MDKFGRSYELYVQEQNSAVSLLSGLATPSPLTSTDDGFIKIALPFTIEFDIKRNILSSANVSSIRVLNLSENNRKKIFKPQYDYGSSKQVLLKAGYGTNVPVIFSGFIQEAWSVREFNNFVTQIDSYDGGFAFTNAISDTTFQSGTSISSVLSSLIGDLPGVSHGVIGNYPGTLSRGNAYSGATVDLLRSLSGGGFFIDNGKAHVLRDNECLDGAIQVINSQSGLLGTPKLEGGVYVVFEMLFEPRLSIGQIIQLDSITGANFNGFYKVVGVHHKGMISDAVCGDATTTVQLLNPSNSLSVVG